MCLCRRNSQRPVLRRKTFGSARSHRDRVPRCRGSWRISRRRLQVISLWCDMTIVRQLVHRWLIVLVSVAGSISTTGVAAAECSPGAPANDSQLCVSVRHMTVDRPAGSGMAQGLSKAGASDCVCRSRGLATATRTAGRRFHENRGVRSATLQRNMSHSRARVAEKRGGSFPRRATQSSEHVVLGISEEVNDDTTSDEPVDDDDGRDDLNGDDDSHAPSVVRLHGVAHDLTAPRLALASSWTLPVAPTFLTSQRLRC
jgi:hypothetical protein